MSRTRRKHRQTGKPLHDGDRQYVSVHCEHHGRCSWCEGNRTFTRAPDIRQALAEADHQIEEDRRLHLERSELARMIGVMYRNKHASIETIMLAEAAFYEEHPPVDVMPDDAVLCAIETIRHEVES